MRMKQVTHGTKRCICCGRPAIIWAGWVRRGREPVLAGWCRRCWKSRPGYSGKYEPTMGRRKV